MDRNKPRICIKQGAVVEFVKTVLKGDITIGKGTVVHPTVQILAEGGPIVIGENNLLEEGVTIHNIPAGDGPEQTMAIGDNNHFEVRSYSKALGIGNNNIVQMTAKLGRDVKLANGCIVGVGMDLENAELADRSHIYMHDGMIQERTGGDMPLVQTQQLEYLRNMIPNYHKIHKPTKVEQ